LFSANDVTLARKVEKVIRREFAVEIRRKEEEIELIGDVSFVLSFLLLILWSDSFSSQIVIYPLLFL
jgi:hypothetical protein